VLFDLDGTLYRHGPLRALMAAELLTLPLQHPLRAVPSYRALRAYRREQEHLRGYSCARPVHTLQLAAAVDAAGLSQPYVEQLIESWMFERPLKYLRLCRRPGIDRLLQALHGRGVPCGVLSDYPAQRKLEALGLDRWFSFVLTAQDPEVNVFKPHPRGFVCAAQMWRVEPDEVLFVGDRPDVDGEGARAAGMDCVIVGRARQGEALPPTCQRFENFERLRRAVDNNFR